MAIRPLQRNAIFLAGSVLAGLITALLLNHLWPQTDGVVVPQLTAADAADAAGGPIVAPTMAAARTGDARASDASTSGSTPPAKDMDAQVVPIASYAAAVRRSAPAVVRIDTQTEVAVGRPQLQQTPNGIRRVQRVGLQPALGSGVIVDAQGHIVTNDHVIRGANQIKVQLADGRVADAAVLGRDPETDLAVLKIDLPRLPVMTLGRSDRLEIGDVVLAIGNPLGLSQTVTHGIVSFIGRAGLGGLEVTYQDFIQTDAAINAGNSGGALVNARGELIGINTAVLEGANGLGLAIPVDLVRGVVNDIVQHKQVMRGWIGIGLGVVSEEDARRANFPYWGVVVTEFDPRSPAQQPGGLAVYDKLETIDGHKIEIIDGQEKSTVRETQARIANRKPGTTVQITGVRCMTRTVNTCSGRQPFSSTVTVIEPPPLTK